LGNEAKRFRSLRSSFLVASAYDDDKDA
jgi:hypothetical protein